MSDNRRPVDHRVPEVGPDTLHGAFVAGAKWWEFTSTQGTMWASDRDKAWTEAERRYGPLIGVATSGDDGKGCSPK